MTKDLIVQEYGCCKMTIVLYLLSRQILIIVLFGLINLGIWEHLEGGNRWSYETSTKQHKLGL
jgi:hypothetical protein